MEAAGMSSLQAELLTRHTCDLLDETKDRLAHNHASKADAEMIAFQLRTSADTFRAEVKSQLEHDRLLTRRRARAPNPSAVACRSPGPSCPRPMCIRSLKDVEYANELITWLSAASQGRGLDSDGDGEDQGHPQVRDREDRGFAAAGSQPRKGAHARRAPDAERALDLRRGEFSLGNGDFLRERCLSLRF